ncbi:MAG: hypothetical protein RIQ79_1274 [Verrucomicrobiota bacterium]
MVSAFASSVAADGGKIGRSGRTRTCVVSVPGRVPQLLGYASKTGCGCRGRTDLTWAYETRRNNWFYPQKCGDTDIPVCAVGGDGLPSRHRQECLCHPKTGTSGRSRTHSPGFGGRAVPWNYGRENWTRWRDLHPRTSALQTGLLAARAHRGKLALRLRSLGVGRLLLRPPSMTTGK